MTALLLTREADQQMNCGNGDIVEDPDAGADGEGAQQHSAGVLRGGGCSGPYDLFQFASHFTEPLGAVLLLLFFCHVFIISFVIIEIGILQYLSHFLLHLVDLCQIDVRTIT